MYLLVQRCLISSQNASSRIPHGNTSGAEHEQSLPVPGLLGVGIAGDGVAGALVERLVDCGHGWVCVWSEWAQ